MTFSISYSNASIALFDFVVTFNEISPSTKKRAFPTTANLVLSVVVMLRSECGGRAGGGSDALISLNSTLPVSPDFSRAQVSSWAWPGSFRIQ